MLSTFIDITPQMIASTTGYITGFITDLSPLWIIIVAIGAGAILFEVIVHTIRGRQ